MHKESGAILFEKAKTLPSLSVKSSPSVGEPELLFHLLTDSVGQVLDTFLHVFHLGHSCYSSTLIMLFFSRLNPGRSRTMLANSSTVGF